MPKNHRGDRPATYAGHAAPAPVDDGDAGAAAAAPARPQRRAPKSEWVEYAVALGYDRETADSFNKQELIEYLDSVELDDEFGQVDPDETADDGQDDDGQDDDDDDSED